MPCFFMMLLQHIEDREKALNESIRIIRSTGVVYVIETNSDGIKYYKETEGFDIDKVDPRDFSLNYDVSTEILEGGYSNAYIFRKE